MKPSISAALRGYPRLKTVLRPLYYFLKREPPVSPSRLTAEGLRHCLATDRPTILEIGCHVGDTTRWFLTSFSLPTIYCFEPDPRAIAAFRGGVGRQPEVELIEAAIGSHDGETTFFMSSGSPPDRPCRDWSASGSIRKPAKHLEVHSWCRFDQEIEVPVRSLDSWRNKSAVQKVDFIWMDVQGAELDVIRGAAATLARTRFIYTEYSNVELYQGQPPLKLLLHELAGFRPLVRYANDILLANTSLVERSRRRQLRRFLAER